MTIRLHFYITEYNPHSLRKPLGECIVAVFCSFGSPQASQLKDCEIVADFSVASLTRIVQVSALCGLDPRASDTAHKRLYPSPTALVLKPSAALGQNQPNVALHKPYKIGCRTPRLIILVVRRVTWSFRTLT